MRYMLLIYGAAAPEELTPESASEWERFNEDIERSGAWHSAEALRPAGEARTVRVRGGEALITDGPFVDAREQLAGYYLVDCRDADEAASIAARIPSVARGAVEVRPIWEFREGQ